MTTEDSAPDVSMGAVSRPIDELDAQRVFAELSSSLFDREVEPARVGRFVLLERIGAGGMGLVYAAFDPELDRKVAVKLLHSESDDDRERLHREARALARLRHPNVVTIHEVGISERPHYVAMEFLRGRSLDAWQHDEPRSWREVLDVYASAGEGLAAAHDAGLVHRDFKPGNVVQEDDGRVVVVDFGLARTEPAHASIPTDESASGESITRFAGTPAYMAPEQLRGEPATSASDQFSFCVSMWEGLYGQRPYRGSTPVGLLDEIEAHRASSGPTPRRVPRWLRRAIRRGLELDPAARWPSMRSLLDELERGRAARGRWLGLAVLGTAAVATLGWSLGRQDGDAPAAETTDPCNATAQLDGIWDEARAEQVRVALASPGLGGTTDRAARVVDLLDDYARAWHDARLDACKASPSLEPQRRACFDDRRDDLGSAIDLLRAPNTSVVAHALEIVPSPGAIEDCGAVARTEAGALPSDDAARSDREAVAHIRALARSGQLEQARREADELEERARARGDDALLARVEVRRGRLAIVGDTREDAVRSFQAAVVAAERSGDDVTRLEALRGLAEALIETARLDEAARAIEVAEAAYSRFDRHPRRWDALLLRLRGELAYAQRDFEAAEQRFRAALEQLHDDPSSDDALHIRSRLGTTLIRTQRWSEAEAELRGVEAVLRERYGDDFPGLAPILSSIGGVMIERKDDHADPDAAIALMKDALAIRTRASGPDSPSLVKTLHNLSAVLSRLRRTDEAIEMMGRAVEIQETHGIRTMGTAHALRGLAIMLTHAARFEEASQRYREACELLAEVRGDDPDAQRLRASAVELHDQGRFEEATDAFRRAFVAVAEREAPPSE